MFSKGLFQRSRNWAGVMHNMALQTVIMTRSAGRSCGGLNNDSIGMDATGGGRLVRRLRSLVLCAGPRTSRRRSLMTKQTEVFNKYHRYEFAHGDDADFIAYQRHRGDGVCRRSQLG